MAYLSSLPINDVRMIWSAANDYGGQPLTRDQTVNVFRDIFNSAGVSNIPGPVPAGQSVYSPTYQGLFPNIPDHAFGVSVTVDQFLHDFNAWANYIQTKAFQNPGMKIQMDDGSSLTLEQVLQRLRQVIDQGVIIARQEQQQQQQALAASIGPLPLPLPLIPHSTSSDPGIIQAMINSIPPPVAPERILDMEAFEPEAVEYVKIRDWLKKDPNNFVISPGLDTSWEAHSIPRIQTTALLQGEVDNMPPKPAGLPDPYYKMFYKCKNGRIEKNADGSPTQVYVKISFFSTIIEKPDWVFDGPPPEPRVFELVPTGENAILGANNWVDG